MDDLINGSFDSAAHLESKSLEDLRVAATFEDSGIAYDSVITNRGDRQMLVVCFTSEDSIRDLCRVFGIDRDSGDDSWSDITVLGALRQASESDGISARVLNSSSSFPKSIALLSTDPDSTTNLWSSLNQ